jgi:hypothetical protein
MRMRFEEFALSLHPDKTRLIEFGRLAAARRARRGLGKPETFTFLGFTFICGKSRQGKFLLCRKTRRDRMRAKLREIKEELRRRLHQPIPEQGHWLRQVVSGFFNYHAVPTNGRALVAFRSCAPRMDGTPCKRMTSAGRVDDDGRGDGLGRDRPRAGRADVAATEDRGGAAPAARRGPRDGLARAGRDRSHAQRVA